MRNHADPDLNPGQTSKSLKWNFYMKNSLKVGKRSENILTKVQKHFWKGWKLDLFVNFGQFPCSRIQTRIPYPEPNQSGSMRIRIHNTSLISFLLCCKSIIKWDNCACCNENHLSCSENIDSQLYWSAKIYPSFSGSELFGGSKNTKFGFQSLLKKLFRAFIYNISRCPLGPFPSNLPDGEC
jgi:hypothetical protein